MKINTVSYLYLMEQARAESLSWHQANAPKLTEKQLEAYRAGFEQGWRALISTLKLHKGLKTK